VADGVVVKMEVLDLQAGCFRSAGAGVVQKLEQRMIATAQRGAAVGSGKQGVHLRLFQVGEFVSMKALKRNGANRSAPCNVLWAMVGNEVSEGVDGGQTLVAGTDRALALPFQVIEKVPEDVAGEIGNIQSVDGSLFASADKRQQKRERITIAALCVPGEVAFRAVDVQARGASGRA